MSSGAPHLNSIKPGGITLPTLGLKAVLNEPKTQCEPEDGRFTQTPHLQQVGNLGHDSTCEI